VTIGFEADMVEEMLARLTPLTLLSRWMLPAPLPNGSRDSQREAIPQLLQKR